MILRRTLEAELAVNAVYLAGHFTVELIHVRTGLIKRRLEFSNLLTNAGMNYLASVGSVQAAVDFAAVGTESTLPAFTDITLGNEVGRTNNTNSTDAQSNIYVAGPPEYWAARYTKLFTESQANGNLTEIGMFNVSTNGTLFNRQLLRDALGNPTTITKTNEEQLRVIFEMRAYIPPGDAVGSFDVTDIADSYSYTARPIGTTDGQQFGWGTFPFISDFRSNGLFATGHKANESLVIPARTASHNGTGSSSTVGVAYVPGSFELEATAIWEPSAANFALGVGQTFGLNCTNFTSRPVWSFTFNKRIPKTDTRRLRLTYRYKLARFTP